MTDTSLREINRKLRVRQIPVEYIKRPVEERKFDFNEVVLGYTPETAVAEASRCVQCPEPQACLLNCPANNDIPEALWLISQGDFLGAAKVFAQTSTLPEICGRVCPNLCQQGCVLNRYYGPVSIGKLEAFVADIARAEGLFKINVPEQKTGKRVAVVGSGPAGLTVAEDLIKLGHDVTVYEAWPVPGGVLVYGIPNFKLEKQVVLRKVRDLEEAGVKFITNTRVGEDITIDELMEQFDAVFLGTGAGVQARMNIPGEDLKGIYTSTDFLIRANVPAEMRPPHMQEPPEVGRRVAVIGGGDSAVDCARTSIRLGAEEVTIVYRRTEAEMPGNKTERQVCIDEGAKIEYLQAPVEYIGDENGHVKAMKVVKMELGEPDSSGRRRPVPIEGSEFIMEVDTVVLAIGFWPDPLLGEKTPNLATHKWGLIVADEETGRTTREGVFAAGDNVHGPDLVITAIAGAHKAARSIDAYLRGEKVEPIPPPPPRKR
ncbi:MAG: NADPH-dependent glutamate synthase [Chloroflexi bacterium]|nr:MAG: NADPH-dependent glutamate synthase [Chloroflexota bacterium]